MKRSRPHPVFQDFSAYRGFRPRLCRPCRAYTQGEVESKVISVKRFLRGKAFDSLDYLKDSLMH